MPFDRAHRDVYVQLISSFYAPSGGHGEVSSFSHHFPMAKISVYNILYKESNL
jgi:hypothetical protein